MDIDITKPGRSDEKSLDVHLKEKALVEEVQKAKQLIDSIELPSDLKDGLSFLDLKNDTMISYLVDLGNIILRKAQGEKIEGHESIERICEYRLILEKSKGINQKLSYQLNRLLTARDTNERMNLDDFDFNDQVGANECDDGNIVDDERNNDQDSDNGHSEVEEGEEQDDNEEGDYEEEDEEEDEEADGESGDSIEDEDDDV